MALHHPTIDHTPRACFLGDIENLAGRPTGPTGDDVRAIAAAVYKTFGHMELHPVVACAHCNAECVWFNWPEARRLVRSGPDGADLALLDSLRAPDEVVQRFDGVVVASGDHIFSDLVLDLADAGGTVVVVWGEGALSRHLVGAARTTVPLFAPESAGPGPDDHHLMA